MHQINEKESLVCSQSLMLCCYSDLQQNNSPTNHSYAQLTHTTCPKLHTAKQISMLSTRLGVRIINDAISLYSIQLNNDLRTNLI